jgi:hypothetical protein
MTFLFFRHCLQQKKQRKNMEKQRSKQAQKQGKGENRKTGNLEKQKARKN